MADRSVPTNSALAPIYAPIEEDALQMALRHHAWHTEQKKWPYAHRWFINTAFLNGQQYPHFAWDGNVLRYTSGAPRSDGDFKSMIPRTSDNRLVRPHESNVAMLTETGPYPRVTPMTGDTEDLDAARASEVTIETLWEYLGIPSRLRTLGGYMSAMGTSAIQSEYGLTDRPRPDGEGFVEDEKALVWSPFQFGVDPMATHEDDSFSWIYTQSFCDIEWIKDMYGQGKKSDGFFPEKVDDVNEDAGHTYPLFWYERLKDILDQPDGWAFFGSSAYNTSQGSAPNQTIHRVWHMRPTLDYPRGRTAVTAGDILLYAGDADAWHEDYDDRWHSFAIARWWRSLGRFWGIPLLSMLVPLQKRINAIDSLVQLNRELITIGQWLVPKQARVKDGLLGGVPGIRIPYTANSAGAKPEKVPHEPLPGELIGERNQCIDAIDIIAGVKAGQLSGDNMSSAMRAGVMLDFLKKEEFRSKSGTVQDYNTTVERFAQNLIIDVSVNLDDPDAPLSRRIAAALWKHTNMDPGQFVGGDLRQNRLVKLDIASALMRSPEAEQERAKELIQYTATSGMLTPPMFIELIRRAGFKDFPGETSSDYRRAQRMVSLARSGQVEGLGVIEGIDDPMVFMEVLKTAIQSPGFARFPDEGQAAITGLWREYYAIALAQMQEMAAAQAEAEAGGGGGGSEG